MAHSFHSVGHAALVLFFSRNEYTWWKCRCQWMWANAAPNRTNPGPTTIPTMTLLQHYQLSLFLTSAVAVVVGLWVFIRKQDSNVAQLFCLYSLGVAFWSWAQAQVSFTNDPAMSLAWIRAMFYVVLTFPVLLTHFFSAFLGIDQRKVCLVGWVLVIGFLPFLASERFLHQSGPLGFLPTVPRAGSFFLPFNLLWFAWAVYDFWLLGRGHKGNGVQPSRWQVNILLAAFIFGYVTGCTNYLYFYGICIPPVQPFATYGAPIAFLVIAYGVFAYGLFDIQVVIRKSLVYSLLVTLLTVCYFGLVYAVERLFQVTFGYHSIWGSVTAFAVMALAFQPLKVGIQRLVDWLLFRAPQEELVRRMERLEQQVRHAEKLEAVSILAAGMAHEIKNPLTSIKTFAAYLPEKAHDPVFQQKFQRIVTQEVDKIDQIVRRLLDFAKPAPPQLQPTHVSQLLDETLEFLSNECLSRRIEVQRSYDPA